MQARTTLDAYQQFRESAVQKTPRLINNLRTVLRQYILPTYNFPLADLRNNFEKSLAQVSLNRFLQDSPQFLEDLNSQTRSRAQNIAPVTLKNYRSTLLRFLNWIYDQGWQTSPVNPVDAVSADGSAQHYTPQIYSGQTLAKARRGGRQSTVEPYALKKEELTGELKQQFEQIQNFWTASRNFGQDGESINDLTSELYRDSILCFLGWHQNVMCEHLRHFRVEQLIQLDSLKAFIDWGMQERGNSYGWAANIANSVLAIARYLSAQLNGSQFATKQRAIQSYVQILRSNYRQTLGTKAAEESLTYDELEQVVQHLKQCCAPLHSLGTVRSETAILKSWERYLIVALLTYCPISQREIRELEWERSLIRDAEGYLFYLGATAKKSSRKFQLPNRLVHDMDKWREEFRPKIPIHSKYVFVRLGSGRVPESFGQPLNARDISDLVATATYKATSVLFDKPKRSTVSFFQRTAIAYLSESMQPQQNIVEDRYGLSFPTPQEPLSPSAAITEIIKPHSARENLPPVVKGLVEELNRLESSDLLPSQIKSAVQVAQSESE